MALIIFFAINIVRNFFSTFIREYYNIILEFVLDLTQFLQNQLLN